MTVMGVDGLGVGVSGLGAGGAVVGTCGWPSLFSVTTVTGVVSGTGAGGAGVGVVEIGIG